MLLAGAADTPELKAETDAAIARLREERDGVFVVSHMLPAEQVREVLSHALVFCCPSVYEPLGIVNLEAMACETAVVASRVGGIPEVVDDPLTGLLVDYDPRTRGRSRRVWPGRSTRSLPTRAGPPDGPRRARAGREQFSWSAVAARTVDLYSSLV